MFEDAGKRFDSAENNSKSVLRSVEYFTLVALCDEGELGVFDRGKAEKMIISLYNIH